MTDSPTRTTETQNRERRAKSTHNTPRRRSTMSAANRALARLPEGIFEDLVTLDRDKVPDSPEKLRNAICAKLKSVPRKTRNSVAVYDNIKTVGALLRLSKRDLLRALDPILAYGKLKNALCVSSCVLQRLDPKAHFSLPVFVRRMRRAVSSYLSSLRPQEFQCPLASTIHR